MFQQQVYILNTIIMISDVICVIAGAYGAYYIKYWDSNGRWSLDSNVFVASVLLIVLSNHYMLARFKLYSDKKMTSYRTLFWSLMKVISTNFILLFACMFLFKQEAVSRLFFIAFAILCFLAIFTSRALFSIYINRNSKKDFHLTKILVVTSAERSKIVSDFLEKQMSWGHKIVGRVLTRQNNNDTIDCLGRLEDLPNILRDYAIDQVIFALNGDESVDLSKYLYICKKMGILIRILPSLWNPGDLDVSVESCQTIPFLTINANNINASGLLYKRVLDLVGGLVGTLMFLIMYPFVGAAIKLNSKGPVLFKQKRVGRHGRVFTIYKFRSMFQDAEKRKQELMEKNEMHGAMFKLKDDPRRTSVGKWLRRTSLDEFPQFINVLKGEMSLVGTRPPTPAEVQNYLTSHLRRISAKPGITGLWQVSGRSSIRDFEKVVELDCNYLDHWRFLDDLKILLKTVIIFVRGKGAM